MNKTKYHSKKWTKKQALADFRQNIKPYLKYKDRIAVSEAWCNYTDQLCKNDYITQKQDSTWVNPF